MKKEKDYGKGSYIKATYTLILLLIAFAVSCYILLWKNDIVHQETPYIVMESLCLLFLFGAVVYAIYNWSNIKKTAKNEYTIYDIEEFKRNIKNCCCMFPFAALLLATSLCHVIKGSSAGLPLQQFYIVLLSFSLIIFVLHIIVYQMIKNEKK